MVPPPCARRRQRRITGDEDHAAAHAVARALAHIAAMVTSPPRMPSRSPGGAEPRTRPASAPMLRLLRDAHGDGRERSRRYWTWPELAGGRSCASIAFHDDSGPTRGGARCRRGAPSPAKTRRGPAGPRRGGRQGNAAPPKRRHALQLRSGENGQSLRVQRADFDRQRGPFAQVRRQRALTAPDPQVELEGPSLPP